MGRGRRYQLCPVKRKACKAARADLQQENEVTEKHCRKKCDSIRNCGFHLTLFLCFLLGEQTLLLQSSPLGAGEEKEWEEVDLDLKQTIKQKNIPQTELGVIFQFWKGCTSDKYTPHLKIIHKKLLCPTVSNRKDKTLNHHRKRKTHTHLPPPRHMHNNETTCSRFPAYT